MKRDIKQMLGGNPGYTPAGESEVVLFSAGDVSACSRAFAESHHDPLAGKGTSRE